MDLPQVRFEGRPSFRSQSLARRAAGAAGRPRVSAPVAGPTPRRDGLPALVLARAGLDPARYRAGPVERRLPACLRALRAASERTACDRLASRPALLEPALSAVLLGVSGFFRDAPAVETLAARVLRAPAAPAPQAPGRRARRDRLPPRRGRARACGRVLDARARGCRPRPARAALRARARRRARRRAAASRDALAGGGRDARARDRGL